MDVVERELKVVAPEGGTSAVEEWYDSIRDTATRLRIRARLARIRSGNFGDHKILVTIKSSAAASANCVWISAPATASISCNTEQQLSSCWRAATKAHRARTSKRRGGFGRTTRMILRDFNETFAYELKDPEFAAGYLQACLEYETVDAFLAKSAKAFPIYRGDG